MALDVLAEIVQPMLMANIISKGVETQDLGYILKMGAIMVICSCLCILAGYGNAKASSYAGNGFAAGLRKGFFEKIQTFSFKNIDDFSTASLCTRMTSDVSHVQMSITMSMRMLIRTPLMLIFSVTMALRLSKSLSLVFAGAMPLLLIGIAFISIKMMPLFRLMQKSIDNVNRNVQENVTNIRVVKSFVTEKNEIKKFMTDNQILTDNVMKAMNISIIMSPLVSIIMNACMILVIYLGGKNIIHGGFDVASLTAFINYLSMVLMSLMMLSMIFSMFARGSASFKRVLEVLRTEPEIKDEGSLSAENIRGRVEFKNVCFKYNSEQKEDILRNISFTAEPGQIVAIIGGTGSGKSSIVQLIPRLYEATSGEVLVDGRSVKDYSIDSLRSKIGMVLQKNELFSGTIAENLRWGNENATDEEIVAAAKAAQAHEFISQFPEGYEHWIEQGGVNVSGGQKQRLCIARTLLKNPAILILDDSTSAVDTATEARIRLAFNNELKDTTKFIIAQRITSVMDADQIIVIDDGRIVGKGSHSELMSSCKEYQEIYYSQRDKEVDR